MDGSGYFSSDKISCPGCLWKESKRGAVRHEHQIVQAALMRPGKREVMPLAPEAILNGDGKEKQDCEIEAGKRLVKKIRRAHPKLKAIIVADSLHSKQPFVEELKAERMSYILVAKPEDHKILTEWVGEQRQLGEVSRIEVFNTLKNQGYDIEHNYGHGERHLSMNFFLLNLLAFFAHQILELTNTLYQQCRMKFSSKRGMWNCLREVIRVLLFPDWETLLKRVLRPMEFL